jgi:hypothetical protein
MPASIKPDLTQCQTRPIPRIHPISTVLSGPDVHDIRARLFPGWLRYYPRPIRYTPIPGSSDANLPLSQTMSFQLAHTDPRRISHSAELRLQGMGTVWTARYSLAAPARRRIQDWWQDSWVCQNELPIRGTLQACQSQARNRKLSLSQSFQDQVYLSVQTLAHEQHAQAQNQSIFTQAQEYCFSKPLSSPTHFRQRRVM